jgi:AraC-like DNA-binding protein
MDRPPHDDASVALATCRVVRPRHLHEHVEVVVAEPELRSFPPRFSHQFGICLKFGAAHDVRADGKQLVYPANAVAVRPPGVVWHCPPQGAGFVSLDMAADLLPDRPLPRTMTFLPHNALASFVPTIDAVLTADSALRAEEAVLELVDTALDRLDGTDGDGRRPVNDRTVARAHDFFVADVAAKPTLDAVAKAAGVDKFTLLRRFRRTVATTPHNYLVMLRIDRARELLARGASPVDAALGAGFSDQAHLTRWFRRLHGTTPAAYARDVRSAHGTVSIPFKTSAPRLRTVPGHGRSSSHDPDATDDDGDRRAGRPRPVQPPY